MGRGMNKKWALCMVAVMYASSVAASDKVSSPNVTKGQLEFEYRGGYDRDNSASKDRKQLNKLVANYGLTDRLRPELKFNITDHANEGQRLTVVEAGVRWQFLKPEEAWVSAAVDLGYKMATDSGQADKIETKLLLAKTIGKFSHLANIAIEEEIGKYSRNGIGVKGGWRSNYVFKDYLAPGIEFYADTGKLRDDLTYEEQRYQLGPNITGKIAKNIKYDVGYLFGISHNATDERLKLLVSYVMQF